VAGLCEMPSFRSVSKWFLCMVHRPSFGARSAGCGAASEDSRRLCCRSRSLRESACTFRTARQRGRRTWTREGWLYLAVILDLFSRRVVAWAAGANNDTELALTALKRATMTRSPRRGFIHHSDRGSTYASKAYRDALKTLGARQSMSRKGDCWDNAVAESSFASIKRERLDRFVPSSRSAALRFIGDYIDGFYNPARRHSTLGNISPIEFELKSLSKNIESLAA
jgi:transposase InsO family protein